MLNMDIHLFLLKAHVIEKLCSIKKTQAYIVYMILVMTIPILDRDLRGIVLRLQFLLQVNIKKKIHF